MKKITLLLLLIVGSHLAKSQSPNTINLWQRYTVDSLLLDFTIPDLPAFKALGTNPSNILRPSDPSKFAIMLNPFFSDGQAVIPKAFALEVSPWKIASRNWTVQQYRDDRWRRILYNSSFSLGTSNETIEILETQVALGYRLKILGREADLLTSAVLPAAYTMSAAELGAEVRSQNNWLRQRNISRALFLASPNLIAEFDRHFRDSIATRPVTTLIQNFKTQNWNARRLDLAIAVVGASSDSLAKNTRYESFQAWATYSEPLFRDTQLLIGASVMTAQDGTTDFTGNIRFYLGNNNIRGYAEGQYKSDDTEQQTIQSSLINLGGEFRIQNRFWVDFYGGIENLNGDTDASRFRTSLSLKFGLNK